MRVVALVPGGIDAQILFFPTLDDLKRNYPDAHIDVVLEPRAAGAYRVCKSVEELFKFDFKDRNSPADWGNFLGIVRDREYDVAISLGQDWFLSLWLWLSGIPTRIGYKDAGAIFLTNPVPLKSQQYAAHTYHDLLQALGINSPCPELAVNVPKPDIDWAESQQQQLGIQESGYILIYAGSSQLAGAKGIEKIYPVKNWKQIIQNLQQRQPSISVVLLQGAENEQLVQQLLQSIPDIKVTSPPDIGKMAAMIAGANLMLCTDSVPMHLAVAVQTYTIALFGPTEPQKLLPRSDRFVAIKSPSTKISDISPQTVLERVWSG